MTFTPRRVILGLAIILAAMLTLFFVGIPGGTLLLVAALTICCAAMMFMMGGHGGHGNADESSATKSAPHTHSN